MQWGKTVFSYDKFPFAVFPSIICLVQYIQLKYSESHRRAKLFSSKSNSEAGFGCFKQTSLWMK